MVANTARLTLASVRAELGAVGMRIARTPYGEFRVAFASDRERSAYFTDDLADALATGRVMAAEGDISTGQDDVRSETVAVEDENDPIACGL